MRRRWLEKYFFCAVFFFKILGNTAAQFQCQMQPLPPCPEKMAGISAGRQSLAMDSFGRLWIATSSGLYYFDGIKYLTPDINQANYQLLRKSRITCLLIDRSNMLWIGTLEKGVFTMDLLNFEIKHYPLRPNDSCALADNIIMCLFEDAEGDIWISMHQQGIAKFQPQNPCKFRRHKPVASDLAMVTQEHFPNIIQGFFQDPRDNHILWLATMRGLWRFDKNQWTSQPYYYKINGTIDLQKGFNSYRDITHHPMSTDKIVLATWGAGLTVFDIRKKHFEHHQIESGSFDKNNISNIIFIDSNLILVNAALAGLLQYDLQKKKGHWWQDQSLFYMPFQYLRTCYKDQYETLWLVGTGNKIFYIELSKNNPPFYALGSSDLVKTIYVAEHQRYYSISEFSLCLYITEKSLKSTKKICLPDRDPDHIEKFNDLLFTAKKELIILSNRALYKLEEATQTLKKLPIPFEKYFISSTALFLSLAEDPSENLWIGTNWEGILIINLKTFEGKKFLKGEPNGLVHSFWISDINLDSRGNIWYGTEQGYGRYDLEKQSFIPFAYQAGNTQDSSYNFKFVNTLRADPEKNMVFLGSFENGFATASYNRFPHEKVKLYNADMGFGGERVTQVLVDKNKVFLVHNRGFSVFYPEDETFCNHIPAAGFNRINAVSKGPDSSLILGTDQGFFVVDPALLECQRIYPKPYFQFISYGSDPPIKGETIKYPLKKELTYTSNYFNCELSILEWKYRPYVQYSYKLEGLDNQWIYTKDKGSISYAGLPNGKFTLLVRTSVDGAHWSKPMSLLKLNIKPPFWKTWWFIAAGILALLGTVTIYHKTRIARIRANERLKAQFESQLADSEMKALRAQMNPHFLFNCMNSIKGLIIDQKHDEASKYLTKFSRLIRLILENSDSSLVSLGREIEALKLYLELESLRFGNKFNYVIVSDPELDFEKIMIPPMILQPYIENAIWHGILPKINAGSLSISIKQRDNHVVFEIDDDDIGRKMSSMISTHLKSTKSMGTSITERRIMLNNKRYGMADTIDIVDKIDDQGKPQGTLVRLTIGKMIQNSPSE